MALSRNSPLRAPALILAVLGAFSPLGCATRTVYVDRPVPVYAPPPSEGPPVEAVVAEPPPPPPPVVEVVTVCPGPGYIWINGCHEWRAGRYVWVGGYWARPVRPGAVWVVGGWRSSGHGRGREWHGGHWR